MGRTWFEKKFENERGSEGRNATEGVVPRRGRPEAYPTAARIMRISLAGKCASQVAVG